MRFSIITPVFNSAEVIDSCVRSVLSQEYADFEHIIVDNASTDSTVKVIESLYRTAGRTGQLRVISEPDKGISDAFNKGINAAKGDIILILNADDELFNAEILSTADSVFKIGEYLCMHGDMLFIDTVYGTNRRAPLQCAIETAMPFNHPGMFVRREVYEKHGGYLLNFKYAMDYEFILRLELAIPAFRSRGYYFSGFPLTKTHAGGASWKYEIEGIKEVRTALRNAGRWNSKAKRSYYARTARTRVKQTLHALGLSAMIKIWRRRKWRGE